MAANDTSGFATDSLTWAFISAWTNIKESAININILESINIKGDSVSESQMDTVAKGLGFLTKDLLIQYLENIHNIFGQLNEKYHLATMDSVELQGLFQEAALSYINHIADSLSHLNISNYNTTGDLSCGQIYAGCTSSVLSGCIAGYATCNSTDFFPPVAAACFASVAIAEYYGLKGCASDFKNCNGNSAQSALDEAVLTTFYE